MWAIKRIFAGALAAACLMGGAYAAPRYSTREAEVGTFIRKGTYNGAVIYRSTQSVAVYVGGAKMGEMLTESGAPVAAGDTVATYTAPVSDVDIARAELALEQAISEHEYELEHRAQVIAEYRAAAANADNETDARINELLAQKEEINLQLYTSGAEANIASLTAQRDAALTSHEPKPVTAGLNGTIYHASRIDTGTDIYGRELVSIFDPSSMMIRVDNSSGQLKYGMKVQLTLEGQARTVVNATVIAADNVLPGALHSQAAYVLPDEDTGTAAYNRATVAAQIIEVKDAIIVSNQCIQYSNSKPYVRVLSADGTVRTRYVNLAMLGENDSWIILGVEPGDKLITK